MKETNGIPTNTAHHEMSHRKSQSQTVSEPSRQRGNALDGCTMTCLIPVALILLAMPFLIISQAKKRRITREAKAKLAETLTFTSAHLDAKFQDQLAACFAKKRDDLWYEFQNVTRMVIPGGELFLFDLVDNSSRPPMPKAIQAIAVRSRMLQLPHFTLTPVMPDFGATPPDQSNWMTRLAAWAQSLSGKPITFLAYPELEKACSIFSEDLEAMNRFMDEPLAQFFTKHPIRLLEARGDMFVMDPLGAQEASHPNEILDAVQLALKLYPLMKKGS